MSEEKEMQVAVTEKTPPVKSAWLDVQYWPDDMHEDLMRMRVVLSINGSEYVREIQSHLFDKKKGNGIISHGTNLTWLIHQSEKLTKLTEDNRVLREALAAISLQAQISMYAPYDNLCLEFYNKAREALAKTAREGE
jgi:hypothetical protein